MMAAHTFVVYRLSLVVFTACLLVGATQRVAAQPPPTNFILHEAPKSIATIAFEDDHGQPRSLSDFRGKVVLLNIWATWCGPCRREMPSLDRLHGMLGGVDFEVVALSIDRSGVEIVRKFYSDVGIRNLAIYIDSSGRAVRELGALGVPATLLINRDGREIGRLIGPAEWDQLEFVEFLNRVVAQKSGAIAPDLRSKRTDTKRAPTPAAQFSVGRAKWFAVPSPIRGGIL